MDVSWFSKNPVKKLAFAAEKSAISENDNSANPAGEAKIFAKAKNKIIQRDFQ